MSVQLQLPALQMHAVSIGQLVVCSGKQDVVVAYGLGSCVAVCLYDPVCRVGGMLHALLPQAPLHLQGVAVPEKFVDQGVPLLLAAIQKHGAVIQRLRVYLCGGAHVLAQPGIIPQQHIGQRNIVAAQAALRLAGLPIHAQSTGGTRGITVKLAINDGRITVKTLGQVEYVLQAASVHRS